jgi:hypothetical protein
MSTVGEEEKRRKGKKGKRSVSPVPRSLPRPPLSDPVSAVCRCLRRCPCRPKIPKLDLTLFPKSLTFQRPNVLTFQKSALVKVVLA